MLIAITNLSNNMNLLQIPFRNKREILIFQLLFSVGVFSIISKHVTSNTYKRLIICTYLMFILLVRISSKC